MIDLTNPIYTNEIAAREHLESLQWPDGPTCPHCGSFEKITALKGKSTRPGVYKCNNCRKPFSVTVGTLFERSHIPLTKWLLATHLLTASKKGMSAHQLHRMLGVTYKTAWFMAHRIRESMRPGRDNGPLGGSGKIVEADETYVGGKEKNHHVSQQHLKRYLAEFDFRYNKRSKLGVDDNTRAAKALQGIVGKRLTYRRTDEGANA